VKFSTTGVDRVQVREVDSIAIVTVVTLVSTAYNMKSSTTVIERGGKFVSYVVQDVENMVIAKCTFAGY
jgi:hypothetical protein